MSSANNFIVQLETTWWISSMYSTNRRGPRTEPCGAPERTGSHSEKQPLTTTLW